MRCTSLVLCLACLSTSGFGQTTAIKKTAPQIDEINAAMLEFVESGEISGAVTLVGHQGRVVHLGAVGLADIDQNKQMKRSSLFSIASMTKPIVATAIMILQDEGKLNVDDQVSKYISAFGNQKLRNGEPANREITIRDCITHTSGLAGNQVFAGSLKQAVEELAAKPLAFQPGEKWQYSPGMNVAGRIVEIVAEQPLQDFMKQRIFEPLGMSNTTFFPNAKQRKRSAVLYGPGENDETLVAVKNRITGPATAPNPSGGLISSARDMFRFYQMILNGGKFRKQRIVSTEAVGQMTSRRTGDLKTGFTPGNCWGLGWCIVSDPQGVTASLSRGTFGHGGAFGTQGWVDPKTGTIHVLMIQRTKLENSDGSDMRRMLHDLANTKLN